MKYFKTHSEFLNEAKRSIVHKAAKQGSYPAVIVVVQDGKVIHQEPVSTPDVAPAAFNVMQKKYPKALLHLEDKTGKRLFSESVVTEKLARGLKPLLKLGTTITEKREDVGKFNTVKKVIKELGRRPSEQELATFITKNYYDVTEVERGEDDPSANDKIADLVAFYKFDIDDWSIAWVDAQNESTITEGKFNKKSLMRAMKKDDGMIQLGNGQEYVIYNPNNGNDDNTDMWQDKVIFALDQDGEEHEIKYSDIVRYDESRKINLKQDHLSSEEYQKAKTLKDFNKEDWKWNSKSGLYDKVNESAVTENRDAKTIVKAFMKAYNKGEEVDAQDWEQFMYDWAVMRNGNDELEDEVSYDTMDDVLDMLYKKGYKKIDDEAIIKLYEATDLNDPVLVSYRATRKTLPKFKPAKAKSRRLSFDKYMDLLDARLDIDQQIKDLRDEMSQTLRDMEQEAEPEGGEIADEYGSTMMKQETEYAKLMAKKDKIMARIDKHRMA